MVRDSFRLSLVVLALLLVLVPQGTVASADFGDPAAPDPDAWTTEPAPGALYADPGGRFEITIPAGWEAQSGAPGDGLYLWRPPGNAYLSVSPSVRCSTQPGEALQILQDQVALGRYSGLTPLDPPAPLALNGYAAADTFFSHYLAEGIAYQKRAVVLAPDWSLAWTFAGAMNNATALPLADEINATLATLRVLGGPGSESLVHTAAHFRIEVPFRWTAATNATVGGERVDVLLNFTFEPASIVVLSESGAVNGTASEARQIAQSTVDALAAEPSFTILEPVTEAEVDGHPAATAAIRWRPGNETVEQTITVIVGAEWSTSWAVLGTMAPDDAPVVRSCVNATLATMDILGAPTGNGQGAAPTDYQTWLLLASIATLVEGTVLGVLIARLRRRYR